MVPAQQGQPFIPAPSQQFRPLGQIPSSNIGMPTVQNQQLQFSQPMQQFPLRPGQPAQVTPSSQAIPAQYVQTNRPLTSGSPQAQQIGPPLNNNMPGLGASGMPLSSSYTVRPHIYSTRSVT